MSTPDTRLEEALDAVLMRYHIPMYLVATSRVKTGVGEYYSKQQVADRGDLASDLADAARALLKSS